MRVRTVRTRNARKAPQNCCSPNPPEAETAFRPGLIVVCGQPLPFRCAAARDAARRLTLERRLCDCLYTGLYLRARAQTIERRNGEGRQ